MKIFPKVMMFVFLLGLVSFGDANAKVIAKCKGLMLPDEIKDGEISWQLLDSFALYVETDASGLSARGGHPENPVSLSADEVVRTVFGKEDAHAILARFQMIDEASGLPFNVFGIDPGDVTSGVHYNIGTTANAQDGAGMGLFVFKNDKRKTVGKLVQVGWLLGTCKK